MIPVLRMTVIVAVAALCTLARPAAPREGERVVLRPSGDVRAMCRAGDALWMGTAGGIFVYDLIRERYVDTVVAGARLPSNSVRALSAIGSAVYAGTDDGLAVFEGGEVQLLTPSHTAGLDSIPLERIRSIDAGMDGRLFIGTYGLGLGVIQGDTNWTITRDDSLLDNKVYGTAQEDTATIYFATSMGLCAWRDSVWVGFQAGAGIPRGEVRQIIPAEGGYYLRVAGQGIFRFDGNHARRLSRPTLFPEGDVAAAVLDDAGRLWAAGRYGGVATFSGGQWTRVAKGEASVWKRPWRCAAADDEGGVFFGSADGVVLAIRDGRMTPIAVPKGLAKGAVSTILTDASGSVFVLNASRLIRFDPGSADAHTENIPGPVAAIALSPAGGVWAAGRYGVFRRDPDGFIEFPTDPRERDPAFEHLCFDAVGNLWVATQSGRVYRYDGEVWMRMARPQEVGGPILGLVATPDDAVAALLAPSGQTSLVRYRGAGWRPFAAEAFQGQRLVDAVRAPDGTLLVATAKRVWGFRDERDGWRMVTSGTESGAEAPPLQPPPGESFSCLGFDEDGALIVGAGDWVGLATPEGARWISTLDLLGAADVSEIEVTRGELWLGFEHDGLARVALKSLW